MLCPMSSNSTLLCPDVQSGGNDWSRCGRNHFLDLLSKMKNTSEYTNKFDSTDIYIYTLEVNHKLKNGGSFWMMINLTIKKW